jgi:hypothetical protein
VVATPLSVISFSDIYLFRQDLCPRLTAELGEEVKDILSLLLRPLAINYAAILYDAMKVCEHTLSLYLYMVYPIRKSCCCQKTRY